MMRILIYLSIILLSLQLSAFADEDKIEVGIDEQLGAQLPLDVEFRNSEGKIVRLADVISKPTVLAFVYYNCPAICNPMLLELTDVVNKTDLDLGVDYNIVTISIDEEETPKIAAEKKRNFLSALDRKPSEKSWQFLTGEIKNIKTVTDAAGFYFKKEGDDFAHSGSLIFIDEEGKICRYLFPSYSDSRGFGILPFDFKMAIVETSEGKITPTISKVLQFCFSYDPEGQTYVLNFTRIFGAGILLFAGIFFLIIKLKPKKETIKKR